MGKKLGIVIAFLASVLLWSCDNKTDDPYNQGIGHTKDYLKARSDPNRNKNITDIDIKNLIELYPELPSSWVKKLNKETVGVDGQEIQRVNFVIIDGSIAWAYSLRYLPDGSFQKGFSIKNDAKEYDPKYKDIIKSVNKKVRDEMERKNISGIGSVHTFWDLKKKTLKREGIRWRSPSELNPGILFD